jgi:integrase
MASITTTPNGHRLIQFVVGDNRRRTIRLGKVSLKTTEKILVKVEALHSAAVANVSWDVETAKWVAGLSPVLADKLASVGLIPKRQERNKERLKPFLDTYVAGRTDVKPGTTTNLKIGADRMVQFFGSDRELSSINAGDCDDWLVWLKERFAGATVGKTVKWAKQFFRAAVRKKLLTENPFDDVKPPSMANEARKFFIDRETAYKVLEACPDAEWRLLFALSRFGGMRCPSEHFALRWADVDWDKGRLQVHSPKTEHHEGKAERWVPIFPELLPYLEEAFDLAQERAVYVIGRHRDPKVNLRTQLNRILGKAGVSPWPRLFHNLRASRETELAAEFPMHVVCAWIGNSERIAVKHYLQVTDDYFDRANGSAAKSDAVNAENALQNPVQQPAARPRTGPQDGPNSQQGCDFVRVDAISFDDVRGDQVTLTGFEPRSVNPSATGRPSRSDRVVSVAIPSA